MARFPLYEEVGWRVPFTEEFQFKTITSQFDDLGREKRRRKWLFPKRNIRLKYAKCDVAKIRTLWQFYQARYGSYGVFHFFQYGSNQYVDEYVWTGDGDITTFSTPSSAATNRTFYRDPAGTDPKVTLTETPSPTGVNQITFNDAAGTDGADQIVFGSAPNVGDRITMDFTGILKIRCRFDQDQLSMEQMYNQLTTIGIILKGLLNDET